MNDPLVKINTGSSDEIARLYNIGPKLAQRIVDYRATHGNFSGPEDLAKVEGVSLSLAATLSPHIDWQILVEPEKEKHRNWMLAIFMLFGVFFIAQKMYYQFFDIKNHYHIILMVKFSGGFFSY